VSFGPLTPGSEEQSRLLWSSAGFILLEEAAISFTHSEAESDTLFAVGTGSRCLNESTLADPSCKKKVPTEAREVTIAQ